MTTTHRTELSMTDVTRSMTGYDERAIVKEFGDDPDELGQRDYARAMVFVLRRHEGDDDAKALKAAMGLSLTELNSYFSPHDPQADPNSIGEPATDQGKEPAPAS